VTPGIGALLDEVKVAKKDDMKDTPPTGGGLAFGRFRSGSADSVCERATREWDVAGDRGAVGAGTCADG
jgi:hypothetical protein